LKQELCLLKVIFSIHNFNYSLRLERRMQVNIFYKLKIKQTTVEKVHVKKFKEPRRVWKLPLKARKCTKIKNSSKNAKKRWNKNYDFELGNVW